MCFFLATPLQPNAPFKGLGLPEKSKAEATPTFKTGVLMLRCVHGDLNDSEDGPKLARTDTKWPKTGQISGKTIQCWR